MSRSPEAPGDDILHAVVDAQTSEARVRTCFWERTRRNKISGRPYSVFFYKNMPPPPPQNRTPTIVNETIELEADPNLPGYREPDYGRFYRCIPQRGKHHDGLMNVCVPDIFGPDDFKAVHEYILNRFQREITLGSPQVDSTNNTVLPAQAIMFEPPHRRPNVIEQHIVCAVAGHLALDKYIS